jgi:hypothetical protein
MTSQKKIEANRRNAKKSTGPRSAKGKQHASKNAIKFGIYAGPKLLPGENEDEYNALVASLVKAFGPEGPIEWMYVTLIAGAMTRLKRVDIAEYAVYVREIDDFVRTFEYPNPELLHPFALETILGVHAIRPMDFVGDRLRDQRKRGVGDIQEYMEALLELQRNRALNAKPLGPDYSPRPLLPDPTDPPCISAPIVNKARSAGPRKNKAKNPP